MPEVKTQLQKNPFLPALFVSLFDFAALLHFFSLLPFSLIQKPSLFFFFPLLSSTRCPLMPFRKWQICTRNTKHNSIRCMHAANQGGMCAHTDQTLRRKHTGALVVGSVAACLRVVCESGNGSEP